MDLSTRTPQPHARHTTAIIDDGVLSGPVLDVRTAVRVSRHGTLHTPHPTHQSDKNNTDGAVNRIAGVLAARDALTITFTSHGRRVDG